MSTYGLETFDTIGAAITVSADGQLKAKAGGVTIAWGAIAASSADVTYKDTDIVYSGEKFIRYGTIVSRITAATDPTEIGKFMPYMTTPGGGRTLSTARGDVFIINESMHENMPQSDFPAAFDQGMVYKKRLLVEDAGGTANEQQTVTITGSPTGGTFTLTFGGQTTSGIAYNAAAATVQTAFTGLSSVGSGNATVTGSAGGPYTVTFTGTLAATNVAAITASGASLTGGTSPGVTIATVTKTADMTLSTFETIFPMISYVTEN